MTKPRLTTLENTGDFVASYTNGGFLFTRPAYEPLPEQTVQEDQTKQVVKTYQARQYASAPDTTYHTYLDLLPQSAVKTTLRGLFEAVDLYRPTQEPVAIIVGKRQPRAVIANLSMRRGVESWHRKNDRGVHVFSAQVILSKALHPVIYGDRDGVIEIDGRNQPPAHPNLPIDELEYLPMIDGTTNYLTQHSGRKTIALSGAVRPLLIEQGLGHVWDTFVSTSS